MDLKDLREGSLPRRIILFIISLFFVALSVRLSIIAGLGTGPGTAFSLAMSKIVGMEVSFWMLMMNLLCVLVQILVLGRKFNPLQLVQVPASLLFSLFVQYVDPLVNWWVAPNYIVRLIQLLISIFFGALGVLCVVKAGIIRMPMENMFLALQTRINLKVGTMKIIYDVFWLVAALALSFFYLMPRGALTFKSFTDLAGIREGTFIAAFLTGLCMNILDRLIGSSILRLCKMKEEEKA